MPLESQNPTNTDAHTQSAGAHSLGAEPNAEQLCQISHPRRLCASHPAPALKEQMPVTNLYVSNGKPQARDSQLTSSLQAWCSACTDVDIRLVFRISWLRLRSPYHKARSLHPVLWIRGVVGYRISVPHGCAGPPRRWLSSAHNAFALSSNSRIVVRRVAQTP